MSRAIYWYRNIRTKQVLVSTENSVLARPALVKGQIRPNLRPSVLRPDHWKPALVADGFDTQRAHDNIFTMASQPGHPLVSPSAADIKKYTLLPNTRKRLVDMDMLEGKIAQLARIFVYMDAMKSASIPEKNAIRLFWEDRSWIEAVEAAGLNWPEWVQHCDLEVKRGSIIINKELRETS
ncbi:hypothetical protein H4R20_000393 [Coemansia guatemalensis]|uniref:Uncharacterized protein n=1 Tax=Coemansia guatemalensis TaxID=2761395 RepID=A0A9W8I1I8_9FUNG|nr:hypothetical protein H4R20_000393 [Coemansia guatemalensis]